MAEDVSNLIATRRHQIFPVLSASDIARIRLFGTVHRFAKSERLFRRAKRVPGCSW